MRPALLLRALFFRALLCPILLFPALPLPDAHAQQPTGQPGQAPILLLPTTDLTLHTDDGQTVTAQVELATTPQSQSQGLMYRRQLATNQGMLFVFDRAAGCFWMRNTLIPLSIAFIDAQGIIGQINTMQPLSDAPHCPQLVAPYALEMNAGWFGRNGIKTGDRVSGLPAMTQNQERR